MSKPSTVTLRIPKELKHRLEDAAKQQGVSLNQFALYILSSEVTRLEVHEDPAWQELDEKYQSEKSNQQVLTDARQVLSKVGKKSVPVWDRLE